MHNYNIFSMALPRLITVPPFLTPHPSPSSGFSHLQPGVFLLDGSNGACQTMAVVGAVVAGMMQIAAWSYRLPR
jgi:hypothetical protein